MYRRLLIFLWAISASSAATAQQGTVSIEADPGIDRLLNIYKEARANADYYTIQVGFGTYDDAEELKDEVSMVFPEYEPNIVFDSPTYRVQIGKFSNRLEAEKKYLEVRKKFPAALLLRPDNKER